MECVVRRVTMLVQSERPGSPFHGVEDVLPLIMLIKYLARIMETFLLYVVVKINNHHRLPTILHYSFGAGLAKHGLLWHTAA